MSGAKQPAALAATEADMSLLLAAQTHIGSKNCERAMEPYVFKRRADGIHLLNLGKTWEKLVFAARIIAAVENPADVCVISGRPYGQRAVLKFAAHTGATAIAGRFTPGSFTNYITRSFKEPRVIVVTDPRVDHQAIREASYTNIPVIALCDTDAPLRHVDVVVPGNNKGQHSIGLLWWLLAREVLRLRGAVPRGDDAWEVMPDLYFFRDPEAQEAEAAAEVADAATSGAAVETQGDAELAGSAPGNLALAVAANENVDWAADPAADAAAAGDWAADVPAGAATTSWE